MADDELLFSACDLSNVVDNHTQKMLQEIDRIEENNLLNTRAGAELSLCAPTGAMGAPTAVKIAQDIMRG